MVDKIKHWANVCKIHWKEIVTLSIALHWMVDLILLPIVAVVFWHLGANFGHGH